MTDRKRARRLRAGKADRLAESQRRRDAESPMLVCSRTGKRIGRAMKGMMKEGVMFKCEQCWGAHSYVDGRVTNIELKPRQEPPRIVDETHVHKVADLEETFGAKLEAPAGQAVRTPDVEGSIPSGSTDA